MSFEMNASQIRECKKGYLGPPRRNVPDRLTSKIRWPAARDIEVAEAPSRLDYFCNHI
jgi:hypothetical protein